MNIIPARPDENESEDYYSAEFQLNQTKIMYQFKLRKSQTESMYVVVKEGSMALENIKEGDILDMRYYSTDKSRPAELKQTRIKYISKDSSVGFKDHYVIALSFFTSQERIVA
ncbi:MAG: hypothetical protein ABIJ59_00715 [Pseudomonadota bacterium]